MDKDTIIEAMAKQNILKADLTGGPTAVVIQRYGRQPVVVVIRCDGDDFVAEAPGLFLKVRIPITRAEVEAWGKTE